MRIAFDITQTGKDKAGCGYFAYSLIRALAEIDLDNEYLLLNSFGEFIWDRKVSPAACGIQRANFKPGPLRHAYYSAAQRFWHTPPFDLDTALGNPDIVHSNNFFCPFGLHRAHLVFTLYDLSFIEHPEWSTEANRTLCFDGVYHASLYADTILAISEYSRAHFLRTFPHYPAENVSVVYLASRYKRSADLQRPKKLPWQVSEGKFWLCVGTLEPRKNHLGLLRAYARHKARFGKVLPLVHAGGPGWLMDDFKDQIRKLNLQNDVILLGYVDDTALQWLYQNCFAFLYPSFFEGFGLPVLEAMSLGAAVITSNTTSIPEIVGDAGILVNPTLDEQIANAMDELARDENRLIALRLAAVQQATLFSWKRAAQQTLDLYKSQITKPKFRSTEKSFD
jgi:glycosyltransferase involved in cell wall biosynthesis